ncbi:MAG: 30S ribosomal protein S16 [Chloroflexi bacterium]|nr:30S ribosomal protein S16 [Chloroflexota bacterium]MQC26056.1 30S ribosomal protein S16 [Chloroflexota bacterium]
MVRIRLRRMGGKNQPSFRIVAADKESPRDGRFIEILGFYNPRTEPSTIRLKEDRIYQWIGNGAQPSDSAAQIFQTAGLAERYERFKAGEKIEKLMEEAGAAELARNISVKTRHEPPVGKPGKKKEEAAQAEPPKAEEQADVALEPVTEAQPEMKDEPKTEQPAEEAPEAEDTVQEGSAEEAAPANTESAEEPEAAEEAKETEEAEEAAPADTESAEEPEATEAPEAEEAKDDSGDQEADE